MRAHDSIGQRVHDLRGLLVVLRQIAITEVERVLTKLGESTALRVVREILRRKLQLVMRAR